MGLEIIIDKLAPHFFDRYEGELGNSKMHKEVAVFGMLGCAALLMAISYEWFNPGFDDRFPQPVAVSELAQVDRFNLESGACRVPYYGDACAPVEPEKSSDMARKIGFSGLGTAVSVWGFFLGRLWWVHNRREQELKMMDKTSDPAP